MGFTQITTHVADAKARLLEQYKGKPGMEALIEKLVAPLQELEDTFIALSIERTIDDADGIQLDKLGDIVGIERSSLPDPLDDEAYRQRIRAKVLVNISNGEPETLIQVYRLLTQSGLVFLEENFPAGVALMGDVPPFNLSDANLIVDLLEAAAAAGVRIDTLGTFDPDEPFAFEGPIFGLGFGDSTDALVGGKFATLEVIREEFGFAGNDPKPLGFGTVTDPIEGGRFASL